MNQDLIIAIITGAFSLLLVFVGHKVEQTYSGRADKKDILKRQLFSIFEPLDKLLFERPNIENEAFIKAVEAIIKSDYSLLPVKFLNIFTRIKADASHDNILSLKKCISANFNWIKRALRYPYDKNKIFKSYIDNSLQPITMNAIKIVAFSLYLATIMTFPSLQAWVKKAMEEPLIFVNNFFLSLAIASIIAFLVWLTGKLIDLCAKSLNSQKNRAK